MNRDSELPFNRVCTDRSQSARPGLNSARIVKSTDTG